MLMSAAFETYSRDDLIKSIWDKYGVISDLEQILTSCAEELHTHGCTNEVLMAQLETLVPAHKLGYHLGDYNQMRESIKALKAQVVSLGAEPVKFSWDFPWGKKDASKDPANGQ